MEEGDALDLMASHLLDNVNRLAGISSPTGNLSVLTDEANRLDAEFYGAFPGRGVWPDVAACRLVLTDQECGNGRFQRIKWDGRAGLLENRNVLPIIRKAGFVRVFPTRDALWPELNEVSADVRDTVWVEDGGSGRWLGLPPSARTIGDEGSGWIFSAPGKEDGLCGEWEGPSRYHALWPEAAGGFLVWAESCEPGWRAWVDGRPASIGRAYGLFQTVKIPDGGSHRIEFRYEPVVFRLGLFVSLLALSFLLVMSVWSRRPAN
jgi:hypothetical protein